MTTPTGLTPAQIEALRDIVAWLQVWLEGAPGMKRARTAEERQLARRADRWHQGVHRSPTIQALVKRGIITLATGPQVLSNGMRAPTITDEGRAVLAALALEKMP